MTEDNRKKNSSRYDDRSDVLRGLQKKIIMRASLIVVTVLLTAVLLFSLTAAWYNNVANMGGLTFTAAKWNFDGQIILGNNDESIEMAPGDSGIVYMQITNQGQEIAAASVTVSKRTFDEMMQKRVYFYVDTSYYRNGEKMDRVYVSSNSGYAYTVFPNSEILVTEETQNAPALKWEWVYDVLGYYVLGTITEDADPVIAEYIRPIEYDYDSIFTTFYTETDLDVIEGRASAGQLKTIDGIMTADDFITELTKTDGYVGVYDKAVSQKLKGYYPIYVNSEGYGVWAYLCTKDEIRKHAEDDTKILGDGSGDALPSFAATITVTGSNNRDAAFEISSKDTFVSIVENSSYANVKLTNNVVLDSPLDIKGGSHIFIDLNDHTISYSDGTIFSAEPYSSVTVVNGQLKGGGTNVAVDAIGAEVVLSDVNISNVSDAIKINDIDNTSDVDTRVHISNSSITASKMALRIHSLEKRDSSISIIVENSTLIGESYAGIVGSGNRSNSDIQVINSTVKGYYTSIYHPQRESTMTINNSVLEGYTGLVVKGGRVDVIDTTVNGTGNYVDPVDNPSGFSDTGDGILLESSYTYGPATVNVSGDKTIVASKNAYAIRMFKGSGTEPLEINVTGGRYSTRRLTDGGNDVDMTYADVSAFVPAGREQILTYDGYYMITALEVKDRETLAEIVENSVRANVKLAGDVVLTSPLDIRSESSISIDLNGYSITYTGGNIFNAEPSSSLTIINGDLVGGGTNNAIQAIGAEVVLSNIEITEVFDVIKIADSLNASNAEAMIHVVSSKLTGSNSAISVQASDTNSAKISVIVENSTLVGENFVGIAGSESRSNIDIQITNSTIKGGQTSIYHPQSDSTMTVTSSTLEGKTGLVVKGGTVNVIDSTVTATGASAEPTEKTTGFNSTGDGILLESASNYGPATINVSGDETLVTSANAKAVRLFAGSGLSPLKINISGGNYSTSVNGYIAEGYTETETNGSYKITANS